MLILRYPTALLCTKRQYKWAPKEEHDRLLVSSTMYAFIRQDSFVCFVGEYHVFAKFERAMELSPLSGVVSDVPSLTQDTTPWNNLAFAISDASLHPFLERFLPGQFYPNGGPRARRNPFSLPHHFAFLHCVITLSGTPNGLETDDLTVSPYFLLLPCW